MKLQISLNVKDVAASKSGDVIKMRMTVNG